MSSLGQHFIYKDYLNNRPSIPAHTYNRLSFITPYYNDMHFKLDIAYEDFTPKTKVIGNHIFTKFVV